MESQPLFLVCREDNDLYRVLLERAIPCRRYETAPAMLRAAPSGAGLLVLADGYPNTPSPLEPGWFATATEKNYPPLCRVSRVAPRSGGG